MSRNRREGVGAVVALTPAATRDLAALAQLAQPLADKPEGRVFGINGRQISRRIAQVARYTRSERAGEALRYL